jgi:hypothetical protein
VVAKVRESLAVKDLEMEVDITSTWETYHIKSSAKESLGYYELKKHMK